MKTEESNSVIISVVS